MTVKRSLAQFSLTTLLLLTACVGTWYRAWQQSQEVRKLEAKVLSLRSFSRDLVVTDRTQIAVTSPTPLAYDENIWNIYLPKPVALKLTTRDISSQPNVYEFFPIANAEQVLESGIHKIELKIEKEKQNWLICVLVDEVECMRVEEPLEWNLSRSSSGGNMHSDQTMQSAEKPLILYCREFMKDYDDEYSDFPRLPANGAMLWIMPK